jgi:hypothetical protein
MVPKHKDKWAYRARSYLHTTSFYIYLTRKFFCALPKKQRPKISQITEIIDALSQEMMTVLAEESDRVKLPSGLGYLVVKKYR